MADKAVYRVGNIPVLLGDQLQLMAHGRMADLKQMNIRERKPLENGGGQHRDTVVQPHHLRGEVPAVGFNGYLRFKARLPAGEPHDLVRVVTAAENKVLVFQLVKGDMILAGQRVLAADSQQKIVLYKPCMVELVLWNRSADAPQIQSAGFHIGKDPLGAVLPDVKLDMGILVGKVGDQFAEKTGAGHIGKADMDVPGAESLVRVNGFADLVVLRDDLGSLFIKLLSFWRQALLAMLRVKELGSQFTLHLLDDLAESRLGDIEFFGGGASGNLIAQMVKSSNAATVVVDCVASKLERLKPVGVKTILADKDDPEVHEAVLKEQYPRGFDYIIDTTANPKLISRSLYLLKRGGTFVNYGFQNNVKVAEQVQIDMKLFVTRQLSYLGTTFQHFKFPQTLKAMEEKRVDPELAISEIRPLDDFFECMDKVLYDPETVKIVLEPNGSSEGM